MKTNKAKAKVRVNVNAFSNREKYMRYIKYSPSVRVRDGWQSWISVREVNIAAGFCINVCSMADSHTDEIVCERFIKAWDKLNGTCRLAVGNIGDAFYRKCADAIK